MDRSTADREIDALYDAWRDAYRRADVGAVMDMLTPDYVLLAPGAPPVHGSALRPLLAAAFAANDVVIAFESQERIVHGDLAFEWGWDVQTVRPKAGGDTRRQRQRVAVLLARGDDGRWRFARGFSQPGPAS